MRNNLVGGEDQCRPQQECRDEQPCCESEARCCDDRPNGGLVAKYPDKARSINIEQMDYGYIVRVGCQTFAVETIEKVINNLVDYLQDPGKTEQEWYKTRTLK